MKLNFTDFNVDDCGYDYVKIYSGWENEDTVLGDFCGAAIPGVVTSTTNQVKVHLHSDASLHYNGFNMTYKVVKGKIFKTDSF